MGRPSIRTRLNRARALEALTAHGRYSAASAEIGCTSEALRTWRRDDLAFDADCARAREVWCQTMVRAIVEHEHLRPQDLRWILERVMRDEWGPDVPELAVTEVPRLVRIVIPGVTDRALEAGDSGDE